LKWKKQRGSGEGGGRNRRKKKRIGTTAISRRNLKGNMLHTGFRDGLFCWAHGNSQQMMRNLKRKRKKGKTQSRNFARENDQENLREEQARNLTI
jgi:hypothetical protein